MDEHGTATPSDCQDEYGDYPRLVVERETLRDKFAMAALASYPNAQDAREIAEWAYAVADAMMSLKLKTP